MTSLKFKLTVLYLLCLFGCNRNPDLENKTIRSIRGYIQQAENENYLLEKRLVFAACADSLAALTNNKTIQLDAKRTVSGVNLLLGNLSSAQIGFLRVVNVANELSDFENLGIAYNNIAIIQEKRGSYDSALMNYSKAILNFSKKNNSLQIARAMVNMGIVQLNEENYEEAFKTNIHAAEILDTLNAKDELASVYITLGIIMNRQKAFDNALRYFQQSLQVLKNENDSAGIATVFTNIGDVYLYKEQYPTALGYYKQSLLIKQALGLHKYTGTVLDDIAAVYSLMGDINTSEEYCKKALDIWTDNDDKEGIFLTSNRLSNLYLKKNDLFKTKTLAVQTQKLFPTSGYIRQKLENDLILFRLFSKQRQYDSALKYANTALTLKDSLSNYDMRENVAKMDARFRTKEIQNDLLFSQQKQKSQSEQINTQRNSIFLLGSFIVLLLSLSIVLFHLYNVIKKANKKIEIMMKELNHRVKNNLQIVSDMLNLQLGLTKNQEQVTLVRSSINRVQSMNVIHSLLYQKGFTGEINMADFIKNLLLNIGNAYQKKSYAFLMEIEVLNFNLNIDKAIPIGLITNEILTNIYKYSKTTDGTYLKINLAEEKKSCILEIADNCGYWDIEKAKEEKNGLGLFLVETFVEQLEGDWNFKSSVNGTIHRIKFSK